LGALVAVVLLGGSAIADATTPAAGALTDPVENVTVSVDYWPSCWPTTTSAACRDALLADIDEARSREGVAPMLLPAGFDQLDPGRQAFVVTNLERVDRGLRPIAGISDDLSAAAQSAAASFTDPQFSAASVGPLAATWWTGIWANTPNVLLADLLWMYQDGWGGSETTNRECTAPGAAGCWGHRDNILQTYGGAPQLVAGVGSVDNWGVSVAELVVGGTGPLPPLTFTWEQALRDGAGGPADLAAWEQLTTAAAAPSVATSVGSAEKSAAARAARPAAKPAASGGEHKLVTTRTHRHATTTSHPRRDKAASRRPAGTRRVAGATRVVEGLNVGQEIARR